MVKDLLASESAPLRLLDDIEVKHRSIGFFLSDCSAVCEVLFVTCSGLCVAKLCVVCLVRCIRVLLDGSDSQKITVVDRLREEVVRGVNHLREVVLRFVKVERPLPFKQYYQEKFCFESMCG